MTDAYVVSGPSLLQLAELKAGDIIVTCMTPANHDGEIAGVTRVVTEIIIDNKIAVVMLHNSRMIETELYPSDLGLPPVVTTGIGGDSYTLASWCVGTVIPPEYTGPTGPRTIKLLINAYLYLNRDTQEK